jgi:hypothetical protein
MNEVQFNSSRQNTLFQVLHVLRRLDPALSESLLDSHDQLAIAARRYPNGLETMNQEVEAEVKRRHASGATCEVGGYILAGDPGDFARQRRLIDRGRGVRLPRELIETNQNLGTQHPAARTPQCVPTETPRSAGGRRKLDLRGPWTVLIDNNLRLSWRLPASQF